MQRELTCMCERTVSVDWPDLVDLRADAAREEQILDGSFGSVRCSCGKLLKPEFPVRVHDAARGLDVYVVPALERGSFLLGKLDGIPDGVARVVVGFAELQEKLRIANAKLDDRAVEVVKHHLMRRAEAAAAGAEVTIHFAERGGGQLTFDVHGLRPGEVGRLRVPEESYARVLDDLPRNLHREPYRSFLSGPYVSCTRVSAVGDDEPEGGEQ